MYFQKLILESKFVVFASRYSYFLILKPVKSRLLGKNEIFFFFNICILFDWFLFILVENDFKWNFQWKKVKISNFISFSKSWDFAGFAMENRLYLEAEMINFNSKTRFGEFIKFYYEAQNTKIQFEIIIVVYGVTGVDWRWKISNLGQMFHL